MRAAVITGPGQVEIRQEPDPTTGPAQVLVELAACGICTFERRLFAGDKRWYPVSPGHETTGVIVATGSAVDGLVGSPQVGERVTIDLLTRCLTCGPCRRGKTGLCRSRQGRKLSDGTVAMGGFVERIAVDAKSVYPVGDAPVEHAAMGEPIACCVHSLRQGGFGPGDRVCIIGGGLMGRIHMALTRIGGASSIGVVDLSDERREAAAEAGADWVASPGEALAVGGLQDVVFVTAMGGVELAVDLADRGGTVVLYSAFGKDTTACVSADRSHREEVAIVGAYNQEPQDWRHTASIIRSGTIAEQLDRLITARYPLSELGDALTLVTSQPTYRVFVDYENG